MCRFLISPQAQQSTYQFATAVLPCNVGEGQGEIQMFNFAPPWRWNTFRNMFPKKIYLGFKLWAGGKKTFYRVLPQTGRKGVHRLYYITPHTLKFDSSLEGIVASWLIHQKECSSDPRLESNFFEWIDEQLVGRRRACVHCYWLTAIRRVMWIFSLAYQHMWR